MPQNNHYKVLIVAQSYLKCMSIYNMLPWPELDCKPIIEMNVSSLVRKIKKLHPDILIAYGDVGWVSFGALANATLESGQTIQSILLTGDDEPDLDASFRSSCQILPLAQLSSLRLRDALDRAKESIKQSAPSPQPPQSHNTPATDNENFLSALRHFHRETLIIVRVLMEKPPILPAEQSSCTKLLLGFIQQIEHSAFFHEQSGNYCILLPILAVGTQEQLQGIQQDLLHLQHSLCSLTDGLCVSTCSRLVSSPEALKEYVQTKQLERYRFFCADIPILSSAVLTSNLNPTPPSWQAAIGYMDNLLYAAICGQDEKIGTLLHELFFDYVKPARNMAYFRAIWAQLQNIYEQVCYLTEPEAHLEDCSLERFWTVEQSMEFQIQRFCHLALVRGKGAGELNPLVLKALMIVIHSHDTLLYIGDIAKQVGTSESYLSRIFKQQLGISIIECIRRMRICSAASEMLRGEHRIKYLTEKHGFSDPKYFSKVFRQVMGVSPSTYIQTYCGRQEWDKEALS